MDHVRMHEEAHSHRSVRRTMSDNAPIDTYRTVWQTFSNTTAPQLPKDVVTVDGELPQIYEFRTRLQNARVARRWSVSDLARQLSGTSEDMLATFERGKGTLSAQTQREIKELLNI